MKKILVVVLAVVIALVGATAAMAAVEGSKHDITNHLFAAGTPSNLGGDATLPNREICVYCHTPHGGSSAAGLLWNKAESAIAAVSTPYSMVSATGGGQVMSTISTITKLCLSCHDGAQAVYYMTNTPNYNVFITATTGTANVNASGFITGAAQLTADFSNDHPVGFDFAQAATAENTRIPGAMIVDPLTAVGGVLPLSSTGLMECSTCHDVHNSVAVANSALLRINNAKSALCTACHLNK